MKNLLLVVSCLLMASSYSFASGAPSSFTYQGKLMNAAGTAPLSSIISLKLDIYDPNSLGCLLYSENQNNIDLSQTNGLFSVQVGSPLADAKRGPTDQGLSMTQVFANNGQIIPASTTNCTSGYTPVAGEGRILRVSVINGGSTTTITPDLKIGSVPNALVAETIQGIQPKNLIGSQSTSSNGERVERLVFNGSATTYLTSCTTSPCNIWKQSGNWVSSVTRPGVGTYQIALNPGIFSDTPSCTCSGLYVGNFVTCTVRVTNLTTLLLYSGNTGGATGAEDAFNVICMGPK